MVSCLEGIKVSEPFNQLLDLLEKKKMIQESKDTSSLKLSHDTRYKPSMVTEKGNNCKC